MPLKRKKSRRIFGWIGVAFAALVLLSIASAASAAPCDIVPAAPPIIQHDLSTSYCELCGYGYVTIVITNPYEGADMTGMTVEENLGISGLTFHDHPSTQVTVSINGFTGNQRECILIVRYAVVVVVVIVKIRNQICILVGRL